MSPKRLLFDDWLRAQLDNPRLRRLHTAQQVISDIETFKHPNLTLLTLQRNSQALDTRLVVELR